MIGSVNASNKYGKDVPGTLCCQSVARGNYFLHAILWISARGVILLQVLL